MKHTRKNKRYRWNWKKCLVNVGKSLLFIDCSLFLLWVVSSYIEIICKNTMIDAKYNDWNLLEVLIENFKTRL